MNTQKVINKCLGKNKDLVETQKVGNPKCDFCGKPAEYDGKTTSGPWGYMCGGCFQKHGVGLGTGRGQRLK